MAFTSAQLVKLRAYLGYPDLNRYRDTRLESAFTVVGDDADAKAEVEAIMTQIAALDTQLAADSSAIQSAGLKRAEDVEWYPAGQGSGSSGFSAPMLAIMARGRSLINRLSNLFGVPIYGDYYGKGGYPGDAFMGYAHQYGPGGVFPLG